MDSGPLVQANTPTLREMPPSADLGKNIGPRIYPELLSQESALGEYIRVLMKRKWSVLAADDLFRSRHCQPQDDADL
jgi:hypothetical protein